MQWQNGQRCRRDGTRILFTREGERWWRKGYTGERSSQVWMYDLESGEFSELLHEGVECLWPLWMGDGKGFYFCKGTASGFELWRYRFQKKGKKPGKQRRVFGFDDDSIVFPALSRNGETLVFRHLFDLYTLNPKKQGPRKPRARKINLQIVGDVELPKQELRRELTDASDVAFTDDGLEIALIAGGRRLGDGHGVERTETGDVDRGL